MQRDVGDGIFNEQLALPLSAAMRRLQLHGHINLGANLALLIWRHHVVARIDHLGVGLGGQLGVGILVSKDPRLALAHCFIAEFLGRKRVAPIFEGTLGELHDVALMHNCQAFSLLFQRVLDGTANKSLGAVLGNWLDANAAGFWETDFFKLLWKRQLESIHKFLGVGRAFLKFNAGVNVLGVLAEDHGVHIFWLLHRTWHALEVAHGSQTNIEIKFLTQRDVQTANAATDWSGERTLDANKHVAERGQRFFWQP